MTLTPLSITFKTYEKCTAKGKGLSHKNIFFGRVKLCWPLKYAFGKDTKVETWAYHVPMADIWIFASQSYFYRDNKHENMSVDENFVRLYGISGTPRLRIPYH